MIDCHVHTARCGHGEGNASDYVAAARAIGLDVLTFTEHLPLSDSLDPAREYSMPVWDLPAYVDEVRALAEGSGPDSPPLVLVGIEADWLAGDTDAVATLLSAHRFDVVLGSVHFIDGWAFDDPGLLDRWETADVDVTWERYFEHVCEAAASGLFDVMAHPDLVKKFGHRPTFDPSRLYEAAASAFRQAGVAIELSTAGLRKPVGEMYPSIDFLRACAREGVPVSLGSDAHRPGEVGFGFDLAREVLRAAGYDRLTYFVDRQPREYRL